MEFSLLHVKVTLIAEYDYDMNIKVQREEAKEDVKTIKQTAGL